MLQVAHARGGDAGGLSVLGEGDGQRHAAALLSARRSFVFCMAKKFSARVSGNHLTVGENSRLHHGGEFSEDALVHEFAHELAVNIIGHLLFHDLRDVLLVRRIAFPGFVDFAADVEVHSERVSEHGFVDRILIEFLGLSRRIGKLGVIVLV